MNTIFSKLFNRRSEIERTLAARKSELIESTKALALIEQLERDLPLKIAQIEGEPVEIAFSEFSRGGDYHNSGAVAAQANYAISAALLLADLPDIKKHWLARQAELAK